MEGDCCICRDDMRSGVRDVTVLRCGHVMHMLCCMRWLRMSDKGPVCRAVSQPPRSTHGIIRFYARDAPSMTLSELLRQARDRILNISACVDREDVERLLQQSGDSPPTSRENQ